MTDSSRISRIIEHWMLSDDPNVLDHVRRARIQVVQMGNFGVEFYSLVGDEEIVRFSAGMPLLGMKENLELAGEVIPRVQEAGARVVAQLSTTMVFVRALAALLRDLKSRGLLDTTLVVFAGEFGRTPMAQGSNGRDHNPHGFSIALAGGGVKGGFAYGRTDDYGYFAVENKVTIHDLHATMLYLLGMEHTELTFRFSARDMRLTDVHGEVVHPVIA